MDNDFWAELDELIKNCQVVIDRPLGAAHPLYPEMEYPLDYGYLENTISGDREEIDLFKGSEPDPKLTSLLCAFDSQKKQAEIKLLVDCTVEEQRKILDFLHDHGLHVLLVERDENPARRLLSRRSVRRFVEKPVPNQVIENLLEAGIQAPSAHNRQPTRFVVIQDPEVKSQLANAMGVDFLQDLLQDGTPLAEARSQVERSRQRITQAPVGIVLCLELGSLDDYPDQKRRQAEHTMAVQGVAMSGENLLLAAQYAGLGAVWMCAPLFAPNTVRQTLNLPDSWEPQGLILVGYPAKYPEARSRQPVAEVARFY